MGAATVRQIILLCAVVVSGMACQSSKQDGTGTGIRLGMTKAELTSMLGQPVERGEPVAAEDGHVEEVWYYRLEREADTGREVAVKTLTSGTRFFDDPTEGDMQAFVFVDNQLVRWGAAPPR